MRVLSLSYCFPSDANPAWGVFVLQRLAALAKLIELEVAAPVPVFPLWTRLFGHLPGPVERAAGLTVYRPRFLYVPGLLKRFDGRFYARGLRRWLRDYCEAHRPDLLDAHFIWPDGVGVSHLARRMHMPYAITLRGKIYPCVEDRSMRRQCVEALRGARVVISVSGPMADLAAELGTPRERIHVIPNGVDTARFRPRDKAQARAELGLPADVPTLLCVGHLKPTKGHGELVSALAALDSDVRLVIVGGEVPGIAYRRELIETIRRLGLADRVHLAGRQPYEKIPTYLAAADVCVLPSHREGCPNVVLEALACGRPVVAARVGAVPEILTPGACGRIVPPRDADALAGAIAEVLADPGSPEEIRRIESVQSWDDVARRVRDVFEKALNRGT